MLKWKRYYWLPTPLIKSNSAQIYCLLSKILSNCSKTYLLVLLLLLPDNVLYSFQFNFLGLESLLQQLLSLIALGAWWDDRRLKSSEGCYDQQRRSPSEDEAENRKSQDSFTRLFIRIQEGWKSGMFNHKNFQGTYK